MPRYEYKVVAAPARGLKGKGVKGAEARFSHALQELMNGLAGYDWEYQRAETLPSMERSGLTGSTTEWRNVLVFRRLRENDADAFAPELLPPPGTGNQTDDQPVVTAPEPDVEKPAPPPLAEQLAEGDRPAKETPADSPGALVDNGVEGTNDVADISVSLEQLAEARNISKSNT